MNTHETVRQPSIGQALEFSVAVQKQLSPVIQRMTPEQIQGWIGDQGGMQEGLKELFIPDVNVEQLLEKWHQHYKDIYSVDVTFSGIQVPEFQPGFGWLIPPIPEIPTNVVWEQGCRANFPCRSHHGDDLESAISTNDRSYTNGTYIVWVRDRVEADVELKNLSARQLKDKGISGITIDERLRLEVFYWWNTGGKNNGKHLDFHNVTLCNGSRFPNGCVPRVRQLDNELWVYRCLSGEADDSLRSRQVVS